MKPQTFIFNKLQRHYGAKPDRINYSFTMNLLSLLLMSHSLDLFLIEEVCRKKSFIPTHGSVLLSGGFALEDKCLALMG